MTGTQQLEAAFRAIAREEITNAAKPKRAKAQPTWTGSDGTTAFLSDLPTRYLVNCLNIARLMRGYRGGMLTGAGLARAIEAELRSRDEDKD